VEPNVFCSSQTSDNFSTDSKSSTPVSRKWEALEAVGFAKKGKRSIRSAGPINHDKTS
jgi:hypothetical protein